jgi:hypothetical protein
VQRPEEQQVSNPDSFINEVAEEVRRDRLYGLARRYGWIAVLAVLALVGAAGWREYDSARRTAAAQAVGDALLAATELPDAAARQAALGAVEAGPDGQAVALLLRAADVGALLLGAPDPSARAKAEALRAALLRDLEAMGRNMAVAEPLRDLAVLRWLMLAPAEAGPSDAQRRAMLQMLAAPGRSLRPLAEEQLMLLDLAAGDLASADARLVRLAADAETPAALRRRAGDIRLAIGSAQDADPTNAQPQATP